MARPDRRGGRAAAGNANTSRVATTRCRVILGGFRSAAGYHDENRTWTRPPRLPIIQPEARSLDKRLAREATWRPDQPMDLFDRPEHDPPVPEPWMKRHFKLFLVAAALVASLVLTVTRRSPRGFGLIAGETSHATPAPSGGQGGGPGQGKKAAPYDLAALRIFNATLMRINDSYVDPTRVDPKQMLLASLDYVQKSVAEVLVEPHPEQNKVVVRVDSETREFAIGDVESPWTMWMKMREIFQFIQANIQPGTDAKELEYAATNGMLSTLDPHSVLMDPTLYNEMKLNTKGKFGGLGIVIGIRKGHLTVLKPMPGTPAAAAGLKSGDKIVRIENESTVNMMLNDAVNRLRGDPDTQVVIWMVRGDAAAKRIALTRAEIQVRTIESHQLKSNIGYVKLSQFSGNSVDEMRRVLGEMNQKAPLKGIILDLRGDPGGLLDQAIKVADEFVDGGTIVTTVGYANKQREEKRATPGNQPKVPMAVLVDGGSASASEIVAGALKNLDRAVVLGSRTFGKGSVQVLYDNDDGSALKLTIAQYLTPGDVSIQSVGIMPDIALEQAALSKERVSIFRQRHGLREQDLDAHLTSRNAQAAGKPVETVRYLWDAPKKKDPTSLPRDDSKAKDPDDPEAEADAEPEDEMLTGDEKFKEDKDFEVAFARDMLAQAKGWKRHEVLASSRGFLDKKMADEQVKIAEALKKLGVDWAAGDDRGAVDLVGQLSTDKPADTVKAGETITLKATVQNRGTGVATQVRGITKCDDPLLEDREFIVGKLGPGESRSWTVPVKIDRAALSRLDTVKLDVADGRTTRTAVHTLDLRIEGMTRPRFAYAYQLIDDVKGNGDGQVQRGEELRLHVTVKNIGDGKAYQTLATLSNKSGEGVDVNKGRFNVDNLLPGDAKSVDFTFAVASDYKDSSFALQMDVYDQVLHEYVTDKLTFNVAATGQGKSTAESASGAVTVTAERAEVRAGAASSSPVIGHAPRGASFKVTGKYAEYYRIEIEPGRPAFLAFATAGAPTQGSGGTSKTNLFTPAMQVAPPRIAIVNPPLVVDGPTFRLNALATDEAQIADGYIFVTNRGAKIDHRKVFYLSNRKGGTPKQMRFDALVPLWPGANQVTVVTRQSNQVQSQQTLIVQRRAPAAQAAATVVK
ncbi:MAG: peptidase S41 [Myxococcales bacterium]|nr:peptidase S41 [Myxococcales bacterium]